MSFCSFSWLFFVRNIFGLDAKVDAHTTLKDLDLDGLNFKLEEGYHERLREQLDKDSHLLDAMNVMDYSLLLGVHYRSRGIQTIPDAKEDDIESGLLFALWIFP